LGKGETFFEVFAKRMAEHLAKELGDNVISRYADCVSKIVIHPLSQKCVKTLSETGILNDIVNLKEIDNVKVKEVIRRYAEKNNIDIDVNECLEIANRLRQACETCLKYAKKPLECIRLGLNDNTSPDSVEICFEIVDKLKPPIIVV